MKKTLLVNGMLFLAVIGAGLIFSGTVALSATEADTVAGSCWCTRYEHAVKCPQLSYDPDQNCKNILVNDCDTNQGIHYYSCEYSHNCNQNLGCSSLTVNDCFYTP